MQLAGGLVAGGDDCPGIFNETPDPVRGLSAGHSPQLRPDIILPEIMATGAMLAEQRPAMRNGCRIGADIFICAGAATAYKKGQQGNHGQGAGGFRTEHRLYIFFYLRGIN